jgi:hypothetical protein
MVVSEALGFDDLEIDNPVFIAGAIGTVLDESPFARLAGRPWNAW